MPLLLARLSRTLRARLTGWRLPLVVALFVFLTSWPLMALAEPADNEIAGAADYWWYFVVTGATVGYGDLAPTTLPGRLVGVYVVVGGIVTLTLLFTRLTEHLSALRGKRMRGDTAVRLDGHVVLLGYTRGRTERLVRELTAEGRLQVVVCAFDDDVDEHPVPDDLHVHFVRGDLTRNELMERAAVSRARTAVVDGRDDNETLAIAVAVDHAAPDIHLVAALRDLTRREQLTYVNPRVQCVQWHMPFLLTEEATDPGITQVYNDLMTSGGHGNTYSLALPPGSHRTVGDCQTFLGRTFGATLLAVRTADGLVVSPAWDTPLAAGATVYYVAAQRLDPAALAGSAVARP